MGRKGRPAKRTRQLHCLPQPGRGRSQQQKFLPANLLVVFVEHKLIPKNLGAVGHGGPAGRHRLIKSFGGL